jgi:hypothetical protein
MRHLLAALGDFVWHDLNADGIQDAVEPGIPDVVVHLRGGGANMTLGDGDDTFASTTTDAHGHYNFPNLPDGQAYQVTFDLPAEFDAFSPRHMGGDAAKDSEAAVSDIVTLPVTGRIIDDFTQGQQTLDLSRVIAPPTQVCTTLISGSSDSIIGGERELEFRVTQNPGTSARVRVSPIDGNLLIVSNGPRVVSSTTVTWDGVDLAGVAPGLNIDLTRGGRDSAFVIDITNIDLNASLTLRVEDNTGSVSTLQKTAFAAGEQLFSYGDFTGNADFTDVKAITFVGTGPAGLDYSIASIFTRQTTDLDVDAGMFRYVKIGDAVWEDLNVDGRQDASEPGVAQVGVSLHDSATNSLIAVGTTDANGQYLFEDQLPGDYFVVFDLNTLPAGYAVTTQNAPGVPEDENSDADPTTGGTRTTGFLSSGREDMALALGIVLAPVALPQIDIQKSTNGQDADTPTGPLVPVGSEVTWTYTVTNLGNVPLQPVVVLDDNGTPGDTTDDFSPTLVGGDTDNDGLLDLNETWTYQAMRTAQAGQYAAIATAIGTPVDSNNGPIPDASPVADTDPSHHFGYRGQLVIQKSTNGQDADSPTGPLVPVDSEVTWVYTVTNLGNVPLGQVVVLDDNGTPGDTADDFTPTLVGGDTDNDGFLDLNETWTYHAAGTAQAGQYAAIATAIGTPVDSNNGPIPDASPVTDTDPGHHFGYRGQLDIQKSTNGRDADSPTGPPVPVGSELTWVYTVTNLGNVPLGQVLVLDDNGTPGDTTDDLIPTLVGGDTDNDGLLDLNEMWTYQATGTAQAGQYAAIATAIGTPADANNDPIPNANPVTDTDPSHHFGYRGQLDIQKSTNGQDADAPAGPLVPVGSELTWTYTVTNLGNVPLGPVLVLDDNGTPGDTTDDFIPALVGGDSDNDGVLDLNETWTYQATGTAQAGQYASIATATATPVDPSNDPIPDAGPVTDTDPSHYFGYRGQIDVEKSTNSVDADNPTGPRVAVGGTVTWTYLVTNPGNVPLASVAVSDDNGTPDFPDDDFRPAYVSGDTDGDGALDLEETWTYQATAVAQAGQYGAIATATGTPVDPNNNPLPNPAPIGTPEDPNANPLPAPTWVTDSDPSHHFGSTDSLIVISPDKTNASYPYIHVVNQDTGELVERFLAYDASFRGGVRVATADLTGDGVPEIITAPGRSHAPLIKVFTWQGQPLLQFLAFGSTFQGGIDVAAGDVDGDGLVDIAAGMSFGDSQVVVFRNTGTAAAPAFSLYQIPFHPFGASFLGGVTVELADMGTFGTVDDRTTLDGKAEIVVGNAAGMLTTVRVFEYSGSTPRPVHSYQPFSDQSVFYRTFQGGISLDVIPVGGDAIPDIVVGTGNGGGSRVQVLDGLNSSVIANFVAYPSDVTTSYHAPVRVAGVDTSGDGRADFIMTSQGPDGTSRRIRSFQPLTGDLVDEFFEQSDDFFGAYFLADL